MRLHHRPELCITAPPSYPVGSPLPAWQGCCS